MELIKEIWEFLKLKKKLWMAPIFLIMILIGSLIIFSEGSVVAPFFYTIFYDRLLNNNLLYSLQR